MGDRLMCLPCGRSDEHAAPYVVLPGSLLLAQRHFLQSFDAVFGAADWDVTVENLSAEGCHFLIRPGATFLEPGVADEWANWHNRGALLEAYRKLLDELAKAQILLFRPPLQKKESHRDEE
jgi:hypothetical protein